MKKVKLLKCIYSYKTWSWIWKILWEKIKKQGSIISYSKEYWFFEKIGFTKFENYKSQSWASLFTYNL